MEVLGKEALSEVVEAGSVVLALVVSSDPNKENLSVYFVSFVLSDDR